MKGNLGVQVHYCDHMNALPIPLDDFAIGRIERHGELDEEDQDEEDSFTYGALMSAGSSRA